MILESRQNIGYSIVDLIVYYFSFGFLNLFEKIYKILERDNHQFGCTRKLCYRKDDRAMRAI